MVSSRFSYCLCLGIRERLPPARRSDKKHLSTPCRAAELFQKTLPMLPTMEILGKTYFVDRRLRQMRSVTNPHDFIDLEADLNNLNSAYSVTESFSTREKASFGIQVNQVYECLKLSIAKFCTKLSYMQSRV